MLYVLLEKDKERKRKIRAEKQKKKLNGYYMKVKSEVDKLQV
jgi:hypothetical protein